MKNITIVIIIFLILSTTPIMLSEAPFKVHFIDLISLFIAFVIPNIIINIQKSKKHILIWITWSIIGILFWDIFSSFIITKKELFMHWYIIYPVGIIGLIILQLLVKFISNIMKMKIYDGHDDKGKLVFIEVSNIGREKIINIIQKLNDVKIISIDKSNDSFCSFQLGIKIFEIMEPFGDNSRFHISEETARESKELEVLKNHFLSY